MRLLTILGYAAIAAAGVAYQVVGLLSGRTATLGEVLAAAVRRRSVRLLVLAGWLWLGWHLFVRSGSP